MLTLISILVIWCMTMAIKIIKPVEHVNRPLDISAKKYFDKRLNIVLLVIFLTSIVLYELRLEYYLSLIAITMIEIVIYMALEKLKNR